MYGSGHEVLPKAPFASDQHRRICIPTFSMIVPMARICELPSDSEACRFGSAVRTELTSLAAFDVT
jgi:hypothetical protein